MKFAAEIKSAGFKMKMVKEGPAVSVTEIRLIADAGTCSLDELSRLKNQPVNVEVSKVQLSFGEQAKVIELSEATQDLLNPPRRSQYYPQTRTARRKSALKD